MTLRKTTQATGNRVLGQAGFTLVELVIVILVIGIVAAVATTRMQESVLTARYQQTQLEMDQLAMAVVGDPDVYVNGARSSFGYVGDVGALPTSLGGLVTNPGGFATWDGPYIDSGLGGSEFSRDAWSVNYVYLDTIIRSTGSGSAIDKKIGTAAHLLSNSVSGVVRDADLSVPGSIFADSMVVLLNYPNGSGSIATANTTTSAGGNFSFSGVPVGNHSLRVIYQPDTDTATYQVTVYPGREAVLDIIFPADLW